MKFCKWIIEKNNHFIELNRTSLLILWHCGAIWYIYNGYFKNIVSYLFLAGCILIFLFKIGNLTQINKVINLLKNSPLNIVIGSLGTGKTAFLVYASKLLKKKKYHIASTFPLLETQKLSLGHMGLLDFDYPVLPDKTLLLWDETNLFLEGTDWEKNNTKNEETGIQEYFALARHFGHIVLASGQRDKHIWVKVRDIANNVIVGIRKKPVNIFRPYLKVIYGTFTSIEEYERWRNTLIDAKNSKKGRRIKYRDIPELDIYFFKLKIPLPILNTYWIGYNKLDHIYVDFQIKYNYEESRKIKMGRNSYTDEFKKQIVLLYQNGKTILEIFKEYGISKSAVYQWIEKFHNSGSFKAKDNRTVEENELIYLRKENQQLRMKNDILKQAALIIGKK